MEYRYSLTQQDQKKLFLYGYFNIPIAYFRFQRRFLGPIIIALGLLYAFVFETNEMFAIALFLILLGIYKICRPFILCKRYKFTGKEATIVLTEDKIKFIYTDDNILSIKKSNIKGIFSEKNYLFIKIKEPRLTFYIIDLNKVRENAEQFKQELMSLKLK